MSINPAQIELTAEQKQRLATIAEREGKDYSQVLDDLLAGADTASNGGPSVPPKPQRTAYEAFAAIGAIGCFEGPPDLSTNPKYMEGFGANGPRPHVD